MDFILDGEHIDAEDFTGASIYLDACFVLTFFDKSDLRRPDVTRALDVWADHENVTLGLSNHTVSEVINRLFQIIVLGSIQMYHENNLQINQVKNGFNALSEKQKEQLVDLGSARYLYGIAKKEEILQFYKKNVHVHIADLIKLAKENEKKRCHLDVYYNLAIDKFEKFIHDLRMELCFKIDFLDSLEDPHYQAAKANMRIMQLDIADSFHLAIAHSNNYNFLATLDGDFLHNFYTKDPNYSMRIIKVA